MLSTLPRHLDTKDLSNDTNSFDTNGLNVTMPAAAAAAFQLSTNFLHTVSTVNSCLLFDNDLNAFCTIKTFTATLYFRHIKQIDNILTRTSRSIQKKKL